MTKVNNPEARMYDYDEVIIDEDSAFVTDLSGVPINGWLRFAAEDGGYSDTFFVDGHQHGLIKTFNLNGKLFAEMERYPDQPLGKVKFFFENGKINIEYAEDKNGNMHGLYRRYYEDGSLMAEVHYDGGKKNGMTRHYRPDGKLWFEVNYSDDHKDGLFREYDESGRLIKEERYDKGVKVEG